MRRRIWAGTKQFSQVLQAKPKNLQGALAKLLFCTSALRPVPSSLPYAQKNSFFLLEPGGRFGEQTAKQQK